MRRAIGWLMVLGFPGWAGAALNWQVTHGVAETGQVQLDRHVVRVKAYPHYLDVEEEAVISTQGSVRRGGEDHSLEIFGTFNLDSNVTLTGMLLWNGEVLLKTKLKPKALADDEYEDVVERDTVIVQRPRRDPAIIERLNAHTYQLKIYPVGIGQSRKLRIRYHVPMKAKMMGWAFPVAPVFTNAVRSPGTVTQLELKAADENVKYDLSFGPNTFQITAPTVQRISYLREFTLKYSRLPEPLFVQTRFEEGHFKGNYLPIRAWRCCGRAPGGPMDLRRKVTAASAMALWMNS